MRIHPTLLCCLLLTACEGLIDGGLPRIEDDRATTESALAAPEDAATTAMMRKKVKPLRDAIAAKNAKAYRTELMALVGEVSSQTPAERVKRFTALEVLAAEKRDGLEALVFKYGTSILANPSKHSVPVVSAVRSSVRLKQVVRGPDAFPCSAVVLEGLADETTQQMALEGLACLYTDTQITSFTLSPAGVTLPVHDGCQGLANNIAYVLLLPAGAGPVDTFAISAVPFPHTFDFYPDWTGMRGVSLSVEQFPSAIPVDAQTTTFEVVTRTGTTSVTYPVTLPIAAGIRHSCLPAQIPTTVSIGETVNWSVYGNGDAGTRTWTTLPVPGKPGLPAGLTFAQTGQVGAVTGVVGPTALNGELDFRFTQGAIVQTLRHRFEVPVRATPATLPLQNVARGQVVSVPLPVASGGNGTYQWTATGLPAGLAVTGSGNAWRVTGTVAATAPLALTTAQLRLTSGTLQTFVPLSFDTRLRFDVYTQNMILFTPDVVDPVSLCGPLLLVFPECLVAAGVGELIYDQLIHNSEADNHERAGFLIDHIQARDYDVVALQEVWDAPLTNAELGRIKADTNAAYRAAEGVGPEVSIALVPFRISAGLVTLVKRMSSLTAPDTAAEFDEAGGGVDEWARKGFVATKAFLTNNPTEFVWVINTHTHMAEVPTRRAQLNQLKDFIATLPPENPVLLMGDLNIVAEETYLVGSTASEYAAMRTLLPGFSDVVMGQRYVTASLAHNAYDHFWFPGTSATEGRDRRLDYILARNGTAFALDVESMSVVSSPRETALCAQWGAAAADIPCHYSDHFGLEARFKFRSVP